MSNRAIALPEQDVVYCVVLVENASSADSAASPVLYTWIFVDLGLDYSSTLALLADTTCVYCSGVSGLPTSTVPFSQSVFVCRYSLETQNVRARCTETRVNASKTGI